MTYPLARMIARADKTRRKEITFRAIIPTSALAMELAGIIAEVPREWLRQQERILAAYDRSLAGRSIGDAAVLDAGEELDEALEQAEGDLYRLILTLTPRLADWTIRVERWHRKKFIAAILTPTGVDLSTLLNPAGDTMASFRASVLALIRNIDDDTRSRIAGTVWRGFQERTDRREIAKQIVAETNIGRRRAVFIARDQTVKMSARLDQARQEEAGIEEYVWLHSRKLRPRPEHVVRDGRIYRWDTPPADGHPGTQPYCGCKPRAHMRFTEG